MDIQGYIIDHWLSKTSAELPVLTIYDINGIYYDLLPLLKERGIKVIDTTSGYLHARLSAQRYWTNELSLNSDNRMVIYRKCQAPTDNRSWVKEPFAAFVKSGIIFPYGPQDEYRNLCNSFLPAKTNELAKLFETSLPPFNLINSLLDGTAYPELEQLTGEKTFAGITTGLLLQSDDNGMRWLNEWKAFAEAQYPGLDANGSTLREIQMKLWSYLLFSEFVFDLPMDLPESLKSVSIAPPEMKDKVYMVCDNLRNHFNLRESYVIAANRIAEQLDLISLFRDAKHLGERVTFAFENSIEYDRFINYLKEGNASEAQSLYEKNKKDVWYQQEREVATFWNLAGQVMRLINSINSGIKTDGTLKEFVEWYAISGCEADGAFRKYQTELLEAIELPKQVNSLTEILNNKYREFTERGVKIYQNIITQLKDDPSLKNQGCPGYVYPALDEGKRVAFIMVDAFRYEMGKTFAQSIERSFREKVNCHAKVSYLPSVTRFGMANHLDDIEVVKHDGKLQPFIGTNSIITTADRVDYLKKKTNLEIQDFRLEDFDASAVNSSTRLLIIRSLGIDTAGENDKLNGLHAMETEMIRLARLLDNCKRLKFDLAVLVADHGFMLQPAFRTGDQIPKPAGSDIILEESRMLAGNMNESPNTLNFTPNELGMNVDVMKLSYAKDFTLFSRGDLYFHEGLSLQENVVPIITVKLQDEKKQQAFNISLLYKDKTEGTIYSRRPIIDINTTFSDLFADDVNIRIKVTGDNDVVVGSPEGKFHNDLTDLITIPSGATKIRQPISIDDDYSGSSIKLTALNPETNATLSTLKLNFEND